MLLPTWGGVNVPECGTVKRIRATQAKEVRGEGWENEIRRRQAKGWKKRKS